MTNALVIGYGSIGKRHASILDEMGFRVAVLSRRLVNFPRSYVDLSRALCEHVPDYVVIANRTNEHYASLESLVQHGFAQRVLVEKPLFEYLRPAPDDHFAMRAVGYELRFHPLLTRLKSLLDDSTQIITANVYVGSYLPNWRPSTDYRQSYSASIAQGGGALRDLSHELDYASWLFGPWNRLTAAGGHYSSLEIESDDAFTLLLATARCPLVSIHVNYLDRVPRRAILVNTNQYTIHVDLIAGTLAIDDIEESVALTRDHNYLAEHQAMFAGVGTSLCSFDEAMETLATIDAANSASASLTWMTR